MKLYKTTSPVDGEIWYHEKNPDGLFEEVECKAIVYQLQLFRTDTTKAGSTFREPEVYEDKNDALNRSDILRQDLTENWAVRVVPCPVF